MSDWVDDEAEVEAEAKVDIPKVSKKAKKSVDVAEQPVPAPTKVSVSVDMSIADVLSLDSGGSELFFEDGPDRFLRLDDESFQKLSPENRQRYSLAFGDWKYQVNNREIPDLGDLEVSGQFTLASRRLSVEGKRPDRSYAWKRPDNLRRLLDLGYRVVTDAGVKTSDSTPGGTKLVNADGKVEQVLLEVPIERKALLDKEKVEKNLRWAEGRNREEEREIASSMKGAGMYDPTKDTRKLPFSAPRDPEGRPLRAG
jgi:hypothetical protein